MFHYFRRNLFFYDVLIYYANLWTTYVDGGRLLRGDLRVAGVNHPLLQPLSGEEVIICLVLIFKILLKLFVKSVKFLGLLD